MWQKTKRQNHELIATDEDDDDTFGCRKTFLINLLQLNEWARIVHLIFSQWMFFFVDISRDSNGSYGRGLKIAWAEVVWTD